MELKAGLLGGLGPWAPSWLTSCLVRLVSLPSSALHVKKDPQQVSKTGLGPCLEETKAADSGEVESPQKLLQRPSCPHTLAG